MVLFRDNLGRSIATLAVFLAVGHFVSQLMNSLRAFHLTQTSVAILSIAALMFLITLHHKQGGRLLTQTQEEMVLIVGFAMFYIAVHLAWRSLTQSHRVAEKEVGIVTAAAATTHATDLDGTVEQFTDRQRPYPCTMDDVYCVVEEWTFT